MGGDRKGDVEGEGGGRWTGVQTCALPISPDDRELLGEARGDADVGDDELAAVLRSGVEVVAPLREAERDGGDRIDGPPEDAAGVGVDARREVDGDGWRSEGRRGGGGWWTVDWSSDVCSSDLARRPGASRRGSRGCRCRRRRARRGAPLRGGGSGPASGSRT